MPAVLLPHAGGPREFVTIPAPGPTRAATECTGACPRQPQHGRQPADSSFSRDQVVEGRCAGQGRAAARRHRHPAQEATGWADRLAAVRVLCCADQFAVSLNDRLALSGPHTISLVLSAFCAQYVCMCVP